jgi:hypothetical protein
LGSETKPWDADWSATPVTVTQATIGAYCADCVPCDDANVEINGTAFDTVAAGGTLDIPVKDGTGALVGGLVGPDWVVPTRPPNGDAIIYQFGRNLHSGQTTSYRTGDEGDMLAAGWFDYNPVIGPNSVHQNRSTWLVLTSPNSFGNTNRFTAADGTAFPTTGNRIFIDHLTGLMWYGFNTYVGSKTWNQAIDDAVALSAGGFTDWRLPPVQVIQTVTQRTGSGTLLYGPFNASLNNNHRTSSTVGSVTTNDYALNTANQGAITVVTAKTATAANIGYMFFVRRWIP